MIDLWLDDLRPAPDGWVHVKTVEDPQEYLRRGVVEARALTTIWALARGATMGRRNDG